MPINSWAEMMKQAEEESKSTGFTPLEDAAYTFVIKDKPEAGTTQNNLPKFTFYAYVESGPRAGARIRHTFNVSENGWAMKKFFFEPLAVLGLGADFFSSEPNPDQIASALHGKRFVGQVGDSNRQVEGSNPPSYYKEIKAFASAGAQPSAGVPTGLPSGAPAAPVAPQTPAAPNGENPWATAAQAAPVAPQAPATPSWGSTPPPPPFGAH